MPEADEGRRERRYLDLLKKSLANELYLENEVRLLYVFTSLHANRPIDDRALRHVGSALPAILDQVRAARAEGRPWWTVGIPRPDGTVQTLNLRNVCEFSHTMVGRRRLDSLESCLDAIRLENIPGDLVETGVWRGGCTVFMRGYLDIWSLEGRTVWAADSFAGLPPPTHPEDAGRDYTPATTPILAVPVDEVRDLFARYGLLDDRVRFLEGWFRDTLPGAPIERLALLRLDGDLYESTRDALESLYDKVVPGGFVVVDDYGDFLPCRRAVDEFRACRGDSVPLEKIDWTGVYWRKPA